MQSLFIVWQYLRFNRVRTAIIVLCVTVVISLPILLKLLVNEADGELRARAIATPLLIGEAGSEMDLVLSSLYFTEHSPRLLSMTVLRDVIDTGLAEVIPLYRRFSAEHFPLVGTTVEYFPFRGLSIADGRSFLYLGESVLGADVAADLNLSVGDDLFSSAENVFDLAGVYPLKLTVAGILRRAHTPDDRAVFVDVKTGWVIAGIGHGHEDLQRATDPGVILERDASTVRANAKLMHYNEITPENRSSFHFHGNSETYPLTAIVAVPHDARSGTLLKGRFVGADVRQQIVDPREAVNLLLERIFRVKRVIDGVIWLVTAAMLLALVLVFALSMRLREGEFRTLFQLGCKRGTIARLLVAEILVVLSSSVLLACGLVSLAWPWRDWLTRWLVFA